MGSRRYDPITEGGNGNNFKPLTKKLAVVFFCFCFFCIALDDLELFVDQDGLELVATYLCLLSARIKCMCRYHPNCYFLTDTCWEREHLFSAMQQHWVY